MVAKVISDRIKPQVKGHSPKLSLEEIEAQFQRYKDIDRDNLGKCQLVDTTIRSIFSYVTCLFRSERKLNLKRYSLLATSFSVSSIVHPTTLALIFITSQF